MTRRPLSQLKRKNTVSYPIKGGDQLTSRSKKPRGFLLREIIQFFRPFSGSDLQWRRRRPPGRPQGPPGRFPHLWPRPRPSPAKTDLAVTGTGSSAIPPSLLHLLFHLPLLRRRHHRDARQEGRRRLRWWRGRQEARWWALRPPPTSSLRAPGFLSPGQRIPV